MELIVTLDHFFQDWDSGQGSLWLCVQPHVQTTVHNKAVSDWVQQSADGSGLTYIAAALSETAVMDLTPVPFPDSCLLEVKLFDASGNPVPTVHPNTGAQRDVIVNDLGTAFRIGNAAEFAAANRDAELETAPSIPLQPVYELPFALGYNMTLRDALAARLRVQPTDPKAPAPQPISELDLRNMLSLAFWGGLRRTLPGSVTTTAEADWMKVGEEPDGRAIANHHGLCGLLFRLGGPGDVARLSNIRKIEVTIRNSGWSKDVEGLDSVSSLQSIEAFFSTLPAFPEAEPSLRPILKWNDRFASRAYAIDDGAAFVHSKPHDEDWFIRPAGRKHDRPDPLRRLTAFRIRSAFNPAPDRLRLQPHLSFKIKLQAYRRYPVQAGKPILLELVATPEDAPRLARFLDDHPAVIEKGRFFNASGVEVTGPDLVGSYHLPWDTERRADGAPTVLYHGDENASAVILRLPLPVADGSVLELVAEKVVPGGQPSPFGERWEVDLAQAEAIADDFDALLCFAEPASASDGLSDLVASAVWPGEVTFEFAQSVSSVEGNVAADYFHPPEPASPTAVSARDEYAHDLINFNALNVYYGWNEGKSQLKDVGTVEHFNKFSELYPIQRRHEGVLRLQHYFVFRARPAAAAPPAGVKADEFFQRLYSVMPEGRRAGFELEHTYGTRFDSTVEPLLSSHFDFPLLPASRIPRPSEKLAAVLSVQPPTKVFLSCTFETDAKGDETLRLTFDPDWLQAPLSSDPVWGTAYVQAWRSLAELAFAKSISLTAQCLVFDFTVGTKSSDPRLAAALKQDALIAGFPRNCTSELQSLAEAYLAGDFSTTEVKIILTTGSDPRIGKRCHVVEFGLKVERTIDRLPHPAQSSADSSPWMLLRFRTDVGPDDLYLVDGQVTEEVSDGRDIGAFSGWLLSLGAAEGPIQAEDADSLGRTSLLRRLLSGGNDAREWIAPAAAVEGDGRTSSISACPIGFRPIAVEPTVLGSQTTLLLSRYMEGLASILDCESLQWANRWTTASDWRKHFTSLQSGQATIVAIIDKTVGLLHPLPNPDPKVAIDPVVLESVAAWKTPSTGVKDAVSAWASSALLQDPRLFAGTKALLYTRLWGEDGHNLRTDFFRLKSFKQIRPETVDQAGRVFPEVVDKDIFSYREGLSPLAGTTWFGFAETLDDLRYDSQFAFETLSMTSVETFLDQALASEEGKLPPAEADMDSKVYVPGPEKDMITLAARAPLVPPVAVFAGEIEGMNDDRQVGGLAVGQRFDRQMFLSGRLERAASGAADIVELVGMSPVMTGRRSRFLDDFILSNIFAIRGDEEAGAENPGGGAAAWTAAWDNDRFYLDIGVVADSSQPSRSKGASGVVEAFFDRLASSPDPILVANLEAGYEDEVLQFVKAAMTPAPWQPFNGANRWYARLYEAIPSSTLAIDVLNDPSNRKPEASDPLIEVFAFRAVDPAGPKSDQPHLYLVINWLCKNWTPQRLAVEQTRNINVGFAPEFGSTAIGRGAIYQPFFNLDLYSKLPVARLERRKYALAELVDLLLVGSALEDAEDASKYDLSITVSHDQIVEVEGEYLNASGDIRATTARPLRSSLPVAQVIHPYGVGSGAEIDLTSINYFSLTFDFQWSSKSNLQFFRLHSRRAALV
ncbi:hypothetical protein [Rhizobium leguminosarum]|uniref:hypothetical protein n=1 Tax=Rhizobium leguminosarum TaxID=384 RepID=UPI003F9E6092